MLDGTGLAPGDVTARRDDELLASLGQWVDRTLRRYHRARVQGLEHIPAGPALLVGNHSATTMTVDTFLLAAEILRARGVAEVPFGLAHDIPLRLPWVGDTLRRLGAVNACDRNAAELFALGRKVMVYPGGDVDSMRPWSARNEVRFDGRMGFARTSIRHGVPIVPVVAHGAHGALFVISDMRWLAHALGLDRSIRMKVLPLLWTVPWGFGLGPPLPFVPLPVRITISVLPAIEPPGCGSACAGDARVVERYARSVWRTLQDELTRLAAKR